MVTFTETGFCIEIDTRCNPMEAWLDTHAELVDALQSEDPEKQAYRYHYLELLRNMMPDYEQAKQWLGK
jgi:DNA-binding FadR family transcriptional regulator